MDYLLDQPKNCFSVFVKNEGRVHLDELKPFTWD